MKKKKLLKSASLVALSAVIMAGGALSFAACGGSSESYEITVFIFCSDNDSVTNDEICQEWAKAYTESERAAGNIPEDATVTAKFNYVSETTDYNNQLDSDFSDGSAADVIYLSPRNVKVWKARGRVLDISSYIDEADAAQVNGIWEDSLAFYGYTDDANYTRGERITYYTSEEAASRGYTDGAGLYTASGVSVGLYGLPKDYSSFTMAFNGKFYSDAMKYWMQTYGPDEQRNVQGRANDTAGLTYTGETAADTYSITYAVSGQAYNTVTGKYEDVVAGQPANFINVGVPVCYKPFNFYQYTSYNAAIAGGDPVACSVDYYTDGEGYIVTLPGFPGETFNISDDVATDENALYDTSLGHITLTYAEFGALTWATTYFCNSFNYWDATSENTYSSYEDAVSRASYLLKGTGGLINESGIAANIYGNGQYEGDPNPTLYTLPWLYSNDSDFINMAATYATQPDVTTDVSSLTSTTAMKKEVAKQTYELREKMSLDGKMRNVEVYYGTNSYNFLEFYGAFLEYSSTWNGLSENCGDTSTTSEDNSWATFRAGNTIYYGGGTWDAQARNDSDMDKYCEFHVMPQAVAEKYALYSFVKDGFYETRTYAHVAQKTKDVDGTTVTYQEFWDGNNIVSDIDNSRITAANTSGGDYKNTANKEYCKSYTYEEIIANQTIRQDKWGARMDSVGYAVNGTILNNTHYTNNEWRAKAAASLVQALSIDQDAQVSLCLGGAQLPNFKDQGVDFLKYQNVEDGAFKNMITPEGYSTTKYYNEDGTVNAAGKAEAEEIWDYYYGIIQAMNVTASSTSGSSYTVKQFIDEYVSKNPAPASVGEVTWNHDYDEKTLVGSSDSALTKDQSYRASAMKVLNMQTYTRADRDVNIRMQYGLNSARDSAMYTYQTTWLSQVAIGSTGLAYSRQVSLGGSAIQNVVLNYASGELSGSVIYVTPAVHALKKSKAVAQYLQESLDAEEYQIDLYS